MSDITLSAGVRQNLLALQNTADLTTLTQNRLATGKKVNTALDNATSYFTSQGLNNRANDLNALLDAIGQAQQAIQAANQGITAITKLVQSAKSIALQAQQAPQSATTTYSAISVSGNPTDETLGTVTGTVANPAATANGNLVLTINGVNQTIAIANGDNTATIVSKINAVVGPAGTNQVTASVDVSGNLVLTANDADIDTTISNTSTAQTLTDLGLTSGASFNSTSLLDNIVAAGGASGDTLTVSVNGGANQVITFGTGAGQVSTLAELQAKLGTLTGLSSSSATNSSVSLGVASGATQNSLTLTTSTAGLNTALGLGANASTTGVTSQGTLTVGTPNPTRASLETQYNTVLTQIDQLAGDASYNGINLLQSANLKIVFNENGTSSLNIAGVDSSSTGLGLSSITSGTFQTNVNIDGIIAKLDGALKTLQSQASAFGSNLNTVQTRQDFTKGLIKTLQTGSDNLVLADVNEEGANLLALQTRQSLSSTALSLSAQADRAVLKLFGG